MTAYTGKFGLDGDKFITSVDGAWNEIYRGADKFDTSNLSATNWAFGPPSSKAPFWSAKRTVATLVSQREQP